MPTPTETLTGTETSAVAPPAMVAGSLREELVSLAVLIRDSAEAASGAVEKVHAFAAEKFDFFELLIVVEASTYEGAQDRFHHLLGLRNARLLVLRDGTGDYRSAVVAAKESIGDAVLLIHASEIQAIDLARLAGAVFEGGGPVMLRQSRRAGMLSRMAGTVLSRISGYDVDPRLLRSGAFPRVHVNRISARSDRDIALRFMPSTARNQGDATILDVPTAAVRRKGGLITRLGAAMEILANAPPHLLRLLAATSLLVMLGSMVFFAYAIVLYLVGYPLEPGWLTTSLAISGSTAFVSLALGGIATGLYKVLTLLREDTGDEILRQIDNTDLFRDYWRINVEREVQK
ncbi:MAG: hypothetical protein KDE03_15990 [Rhodobacteraceae bacterium]|nr:hypothetical protein [Paracoccaceae bacterium]